MVAARLPEEGELRIGSLALPAGVHIVSAYGAGQPVAWATIQPAEMSPRNPREPPFARPRSQRPARIGLAVADRPADVLARIGWTGAANYPTALPIAAVLRSWEDRFGARLMQIGFDRIRLLVERPPRTADAALRLAAEQYVFCDECHHEIAATGTIPGLAICLLSAPAWTFWWD
jgi:Domain of unknown function (DUF4253)